MPLVVTVQILTTLSHQNQKIANPYSVRMEMDYLAQEKMEMLVQVKMELLVQEGIMNIDQQKKIWTVTLN